jgi:hypothetical protein
MTKYGRILNPQGYKAPWHHNESSLYIFRKAIFEFTADPQSPIIFEDHDGNWWLTDKHFFTDWGSIPIVLQVLIPKDTYLGYLFHDASFGHHGLWFLKKGSTEIVFKELTMTQANDILYQMMMAQGAWKITAATVYETLQLAGSAAWNDAVKQKRAGTQIIL